MASYWYYNKYTNAERSSTMLMRQNQQDTTKETITRDRRLTRAPLGYFYNAPHWGGGGYFEPPSDLRNY